jgi:hypothetical protein
MMDYAATRAQSEGGGHTLLPHTTDEVDKLYHQLTEIHGIGAT